MKATDRATIMVNELQAANQQFDIEIAKPKKAEPRLIKSKLALQATIKKMKQTQSELIQREKLASVGHLAAGIAHEINNPTAFVSSNLKTAQEYMKDIVTMVHVYRTSSARLKELATGTADVQIQAIFDEIKESEESVDIDYILDDLVSIFSECREGTDRIQRIVADLKDFAHSGDPERNLADINQGLDATINIVWNELKYKAELIKEYGDLPRINCNCQQINQVFMNLLLNAAQAIEAHGTISIRTCVQGDSIEVHISDTGQGIPKQNLSKIFDPFFTTKAVGEGTGLGLSLAYGIIKKHNGEIMVESKVGRGTCFKLRLPIS